MKNIIERSFKFNLKVMQFFSWYPSESESLLVKIRGYILYVGLLLLSTTMVTVNLLIGHKYDTIQYGYISDTMCYWFKLLPFLGNHQQMKKCINYFAESYFKPRDEVEQKITDDAVGVCKRNCTVYMISVMCSVTFFLLPSLFSQEYKLPLQIWFPNFPMNKAVRYYASFLYISAACMYSASGGYIIDPVIGGLAYHATGQLKILQHRLQILHKASDSTGTSFKINSANLIVYENIKSCVHLHNAILRFVDEFGKSFSWVMFSQFAGTIFGACFCCIAFTMAPFPSIECFTFVAIFFLIILQVFFYCYYGTLLFEENNNLITAIYMSHWYEYDVKSRKLLIILMERSKRPMIVTAEKLFDLKLETFSQVIKKSYSVVALLKKYQY